MLVEKGKITQEQLLEALKHQKAQDVRLGEALVALAFLTQKQLDDFLDTQRKQALVGNLLVRAGKITEEQLGEILAEQKRTKCRFGEALLRLEVMEEKAFSQFLASHLGVPFLDLMEMELQEAAVKLLREEDARRLRAIVVVDNLKSVIVGMVDPSDLMAYDELAQIIRKPIRLGMVIERQFHQALDRVFKKTDQIQGLVEELGDEVDRKRLDFNQFVQSEMLTEAPVMRVLQTMFEDAVRHSSSDIHIEPGLEVLRIRKRVDGVLHEQVLKQKHIAPSLISKLKLMAGLEISERRLPQDGRFSMRVDALDVDVRISTLPIQTGESVVMRIFNQQGANIRINQVGFPPALQNRLRNWIARPNGLVLVSGPTGSGKTTTLYAALNELNVSSKKIITVEDPVEYRLDRINQVQVNSKIGLTFASILRNVLRQDPDVVLVGEMRDQETADLAIRAALTGHLVLSTIHTRDAASTAVRLMDMEVKGYAVASALVGVLAQRLVRRICPHCVAPYQPNVQEQAWLSTMIRDENLPLKVGKGCKRCQKTGYLGRVAVGEMLEMDEPLSQALQMNDTGAFLQRTARQKGFVSLHQAGLLYARGGITTLSEVMRHFGDPTFSDTPLASQTTGGSGQTVRPTQTLRTTQAPRTQSVAGGGVPGRTQSPTARKAPSAPQTPVTQQAAPVDDEDKTVVAGQAQIPTQAPIQAKSRMIPGLDDEDKTVVAGQAQIPTQAPIQAKSRMIPDLDDEDDDEEDAPTMIAPKS
ncbi:MAG: Flp pilus assembly complex ATPase component TadA [Magnetococcales bacterium]|nr:Flp pilus assembly complex ATPase component TadA [Magnetococcales bacterium]